MNSTDLVKFAVDTLSSDSRFKDIVDMSETSAFYNLNILPFSLLLKPVADLNTNTLNALELDNMTEAQMDSYAESLFITRRSQSYTTVPITLYFLDPGSVVEPCIITTSDEFKTSDNLIYKTIEDYVIDINKLPLVTIVKDEVSVQRRMITINTISYDNTDIIDIGTIKTCTIINTYLDFITNLTASSTPPSIQTNEQFKTAIQNAISIRNNSTPSSIYTNITQNFHDVVDCLPICYGDPEMQRDIAVAAKGWSGHFGGMTDILIRSSLIPSTFSISATAITGNKGVSFILRRFKGYDWYAKDNATPDSYQLMPWIKLDSETLPTLPMLFIDWNNTKIGDYTIATDSLGRPDYTIDVLPDILEKSYGKNYRFSQYENLLITIKTKETVPSSVAVKLAYYTLSNISNIQDYIASYDNRATNCNNLIKSFIPIEINKLVVVYNPSITFIEETWRQTLVDLINNNSSTRNYSFTDLFKTFPASVRIGEVWQDNNNLPYTFNSNGEINGIVNPVPSSGTYPTYAIMTQHNIDGSRKFYASTRQLYQLETSNGLSATSRTCRYFILPENIIFEKEV